MTWNPRYVAYASAHGHSPEEQMAIDRAAYPGGCMSRFICWISDRSRDFRLIHPEAFCGEHIADQDAWTSFLVANQ